MTPVVTLVDLDKGNWYAAARLKVAPGQETFVADNLTTIAESQFYPWVQRKVIMADGEIVGLAAYGQEPGESELWLQRFMIAGDHQRKGIGREALRQLLGIWKAIPGLTAIKLSYEPDNAVAEALYASAGFVPGEIAEWGERVATLDLTAR
ncbi:MAG: GNAT family N-acetyltransferase [Chloroflexota bacterium]|nr:GNAT family N-acetyltransferase [Chloroflexota bacterium]